MIKYQNRWKLSLDFNVISHDDIDQSSDWLIGNWLTQKSIMINVDNNNNQMIFTCEYMDFMVMMKIEQIILMTWIGNNNKKINKSDEIYIFPLPLAIVIFRFLFMKYHHHEDVTQINSDQLIHSILSTTRVRSWTFMSIHICWVSP